MKFLRGMVEEMRRDRIRNTYVKGEQRMEKIQNQFKMSDFRSFRCVKIKNEHRIPKRLLEIEISRGKFRGRQHT
jgi:hypothetical protein